MDGLWLNAKRHAEPFGTLPVVEGRAPLTDCPLRCCTRNQHRGMAIVGRSARITVLDWEHACYGDPLYELATDPR